MAIGRDWLMPALLLACVCVSWIRWRCQPVLYEKSVGHFANATPPVGFIAIAWVFRTVRAIDQLNQYIDTMRYTRYVASMRRLS